MNVQHFFDPETNTLTYLVYDENTKDAVLIDPVLNYDQDTGKIKDTSALEVIDFIKSEKLKLHAVLETHAHADHLSGSQVIKKAFPEIKLGVGEKIKTVQETFKEVFELNELKVNGSQFDLLFKDNEEISFGSLNMRAIPTPGHTPACMSYLFGDNLFTGDALFMPDYGTGRCDFPKGSAKELFHSVAKNIYSLPDETKIYVGHDYLPDGRELRFKTTVGDSKRENIHLNTQTTEEQFVKFRKERDTNLRAPRLLLPSIQFNIHGGRFPHYEGGKPFLKLPITSDGAIL